MQITLLNNYDNLKKAIENSTTVKEVLLKLGYEKNNAGNYITFHKYVKKFNIDITHILINKFKGRTVANSLEDILSNKKSASSHDLKRKLYKVNLKQPICELCGQDENWKIGKISLILDHINGKSSDNRLENLRIVCPNCDAALPTFKGKNKKIIMA